MAPTIFSDLSFQSYDPFEQYEMVEKVWTALLAQCSHSFFLSWGWVSSWLQTLPHDTDLKFIVGEIDSKPVIVFFLGQQRIIRHGFVPSQVVSLNATGNEYYDDICIEYNRILADTSLKFSLADLINAQCFNCTWDELSLPGIYNDIQIQLMEECRDFNERGYQIIYERQPDVFWVDLQKIRDNGSDYLALLSAKTRQRIRRSIRAYEEKGEIQIEIAGNKDEARRMLSKLAKLHNDSWANRGKTGAFTNQFFVDFHHKLISNCFDNGELQLLHIHTGSTTLGYVYNFIYQGEVFFYQCAFNFLKNNKFSPGLTSLVLIIRSYAEQNYKIFNFLAGSVQYKKSLSTDGDKMCWAVLQKKRKRFVVEKKLQAIKGRIKKQIGRR